MSDQTNRPAKNASDRKQQAAEDTNVTPPDKKTDLFDTGRQGKDAASDAAAASETPLPTDATGDDDAATEARNRADDIDGVDDASDAGNQDDAEHIGDVGNADLVEDARDTEDAEDVEDAEDAEDAEDGEDGEDHNCTEDFNPAPFAPGEFIVRIGDVGEWEHHFRRFSPRQGAHSSALALSACYPMRLRPLIVLKKDERYVVVDGRFLLEEIKAAHPNDPEVMVRIVLFHGSEEDAVEAMCNDGFGCEPATKMEMAHGLLALQRAGRKSQTAIADQYAALTKDKVSQMLIAARLQDAYPVLFELLREPHKLPISFGVALNKVVKAMSRSDFVALLARAQALVDEGERCSPDELHELLDLEQPIVKPAKPAAKVVSEIEASVAEAIFGEDDKPVGAAAPLVDGGEQFFLPPSDIVEQMTPSEREAAANAFIVRIVQYFGVEKPG